MIVRVFILFVIITAFILSLIYFIYLMTGGGVKTEDYTRGDVMLTNKEQIHFSIS